MNKETFEGLLYEEESPTLDFKKEQYRFAKASDDEKSELLKDIVGFANAWRRSEAYILIGVEEVRGGRSNVIGIAAADHLDDHALQQFVNSLTNQPVRFHYKAFEFERKQVGIIEIEEQTRPIYLKRNYGKLVKEWVYVRRGSSTDPTKPASLEEIAQMRVGSGEAIAELFVEFAHTERDDALGTNLSWEADLCEMPANIPDLPSPLYPFNLGVPDTNHNFFRELANFEFVHRLFRPVRLIVKNTGQVAANNVRAELTIPNNIGVAVLNELPDRPEQRVNLLKNIGSTFHREPGAVCIDTNDERFRIEIDCGRLQPGRRIWSDIFYIGKAQTGNLSLCGLVFADNLPQPMDFALTVSVTVKRTSMTIKELRSLSE